MPRPSASSRPCANQSLVDMLQARTEQPNVSANYSRTLTMAIRSLRNEKELITSHQQAKQVPYIGDHIAHLITVHLRNNPPATSPPPDSTSAATPSAATRVRNTKTKEYIPRYRSGPFGILIALYLAQQSGRLELKKNELTEAAQQYCDEPLLKAPSVNQVSWYGGWASMGKTLCNKGLVCKYGNPAKYSLSAQGIVLAEKLVKINENMQNHVVDDYNNIPSIPPPPEGEMEISTSERGNGRGRLSGRGRGRGRGRRLNGRGREEQEQAMPANSSRLEDIHREAMEGQQRREGTQRLGREEGDIGNVSVKQGTNVQQQENGGKRGRKRNNTANVQRGERVVARLQRNGHDREQCLAVIHELEQSGKLQKTDDKLYEVMANILWERRNKVPSRDGNDRDDEISLNISAIDTQHRLQDECLPAASLDVGSVSSLPGPAGDNFEVRPMSNREQSADVLNLERLSGPSNTNSGTEQVQRSDQHVQNRNIRQEEAHVKQVHAEVDVINLDSDGESSIEVIEVQPAKRPRIVSRETEKGKPPVQQTTNCHNNKFDSHSASPPVICLDDFATLHHRHQPMDIVRDPHTNSNLTDPLENTPKITSCNTRHIFDSAISEPDAHQSSNPISHLDTIQPQPPTNSHHRPSTPPPIQRDQPTSEPSTSFTQPPPGPCSVILILDKQERLRNRGTRAGPVNTICEMLFRENVTCEVRSLPCGDAMFIVRYSNGAEYVLDYVIERKTLDDFVSSLYDGRIDRQTFMMRKSGIKNKILLLEGKQKEHPDLAINVSSCKKLTEMEICYDFHVKRTLDLTDTVWFYCSMYKKLVNKCNGILMKYEKREEFDIWLCKMKSITTHLTVGSLFQMQLCQIPGVGKTNAKAIINQGYTTPQLLFRALKNAKEDERGKVLRASEKKTGERRIAIKASQFTSKLFCSKEYGTSVVDELN